MALEDIIQGRKQKRKLLQDRGEYPYPGKGKRTHTTETFLSQFDELQKSEEEISLSGRLLALREHGSLIFGVIYDGFAKIQIVFKKDAMGESAFRSVGDYVDIGDFMSVTGIAFTTKRGEKSVQVRRYSLITKSLRPLPEKWHGLKDTEERYRKRYLDLLMNKEVRNLFATRHSTIRAIREFLHEKYFEEVETPMLQNIPGGATARPFETHLNAMDMDMYLRIAPELYLKRLLVAGYEKVFEIGRNFRNEGVDASHNPEFTMLELYAAYEDERYGMALTEEMMELILQKTVGSTTHTFEGNEITFQPPYQRIEFNEMLMKYTDIRYEDYNLASLLKKADEMGVVIGKEVQSKAEVADEIYKKYCRKHFIQPTFIIHYPMEMVPLAKPLDNNPSYARSFQLVVGGIEMAKGYSESNDPVTQRQELEKQEEYRKKGDKEAHTMDTDFIEALEYGMPPACGIGIGIDRLVAFLSNANALREIILFPTMRDK